MRLEGSEDRYWYGQWSVMATTCPCWCCGRTAEQDQVPTALTMGLGQVTELEPLAAWKKSLCLPFLVTVPGGEGLLRKLASELPLG